MEKFYEDLAARFPGHPALSGLRAIPAAMPKVRASSRIGPPYNPVWREARLSTIFEEVSTLWGPDLGEFAHVGVTWANVASDLVHKLGRL